MTYAELKNEIRDLGFEDDAAVDEYADIIKNSVNRAVDFICEGVSPLIKSVEITQSYDMNTLTDYISLYSHPIYEGNIYTNYKIEGGSKIVLPSDFSGTLTVYYKARPSRVTDDTFVFELDNKVLPLIAPLSAYFVWLDDDERKATMYFNIYDQMKDQILIGTHMPAKAVFSGGVKWHR